MINKVSAHIQKLASKSEAVRREFYPSPREDELSDLSSDDPLLEDKHSPVKGLCHKYPRRVLVLLTMDCASFCRFCTRRRKVGDIEKGKITEEDIDRMADYIRSHPDINEAIFSGGDPLVVPRLLGYALDLFSRMPQIKILRVHTRVPVVAPDLVTDDILDMLAKIKDQPLYLSIHFEHPDEFTEATVNAVQKLRRTGAILLSQSVFLKGVNDSHETLAKLFNGLAEMGVRPYYIYHCDPVKGAEHFIVPIEKEIEIMTELRKNISGVAFPFHLIDTPNGSGKIPVPLGFWQFDKSGFSDFNAEKIRVK